MKHLILVSVFGVSFGLGAWADSQVKISDRPGSVLFKSIVYTADQDADVSQGYGRVLLAAQTYCAQSAEFAVLQKVSPLSFLSKDVQVINNLRPSNGVLGIRVYRNDGRGFFTTPDDLQLPTQLTREQQFVTSTKTNKILSGSFYCADKSRTLKGLQVDDLILSVNGDEIESEDELILILNALEVSAAKPVVANVKLKRQNKDILLKLPVVDVTNDLVAVNQASVASACTSLSVSNRPALCASALEKLKAQPGTVQKAQSTTVDAAAGSGTGTGSGSSSVDRQ